MPNAEPEDSARPAATDTPVASRSETVSAAVRAVVEEAIADAVFRGDFETARAIADEVRRRTAAERRVLGRDVIDFTAATRVLPRLRCK